MIDYSHFYRRPLEVVVCLGENIRTKQHASVPSYPIVCIYVEVFQDRGTFCPQVGVEAGGEVRE